MKNIQLLFIGFTLFILLACNALTQPLLQPSTATVTAGDVSIDCGETKRVSQDINQALQYSEPFFLSDRWERSYSVMEGQVRVTWSSNEFGAVANFDHVIFCDVTDERLDEYFTPATLDIVMENYDEHELQQECRSNGQRLYEFQAKANGLDYDVNFWVEIIDKDHILESLLAFPSDAQNNLDVYSRRIMPDLPSCD